MERKLAGDRREAMGGEWTILGRRARTALGSPGSGLILLAFQGWRLAQKVERKERCRQQGRNFFSGISSSSVKSGERIAAKGEC